jgi:hypothetical protein
MFRRHPLLAMRQIRLLAVIAIFGQLYLFKAVNRSAALPIVLFIVQWGLSHLSIPLLSGLSNVRIPDRSRATALILISAIVTGYVAFGGLLLGELAEWSQPMTFAVLGSIIIARGVFCRVSGGVAAGIGQKAR